MKKLFLGLLVAGALVVGVMVPVQTAGAVPPQTDVTGVITDQGVSVDGATVEVKCGATTMTDTTDMHGSYLVTFAFADCPPGSTVTVKAVKGAKSGTNTGTIVGVTTKLNIGIVNVDIPEYGTIGIILAAGAGVGAIIFTRRRFAQQGTVA